MGELLNYIVVAFAPENLLFALAGTVIGITVGALPGFTPTMHCDPDSCDLYNGYGERPAVPWSDLLRRNVRRLHFRHPDQYARYKRGSRHRDGRLRAHTEGPFA